MRDDEWMSLAMPRIWSEMVERLSSVVASEIAVSEFGVRRIWCKRTFSRNDSAVACWGLSSARQIELWSRRRMSHFTNEMMKERSKDGNVHVRIVADRE